MELIIDKLRKVLALTESDQPNEAQAAVRSLEKLLDKHHLTMADLMEETIYEGRFKFKNEDEKRIILQVAGMVTNSHSVVHYVSTLQKNVVIFRLKKKRTN